MNRTETITVTITVTTGQAERIRDALLYNLDDTDYDIVSDLCDELNLVSVGQNYN